MAHLKKTRLKIVGLKQNSANSNRAIYDRLLVQRGANVLTSKALVDVIADPDTSNKSR